MKSIKEQLLEEFDNGFGIYWSNYKNTLFRCNPNDILDKPSVITSESIKQFLSQAIDQTREETIRVEIEYWKGVFDKRPKDRDLESDSIAQNFARIEIERLESKIKSLINKQ